MVFYVNLSPFFHEGRTQASHEIGFSDFGSRGRYRCGTAPDLHQLPPYFTNSDGMFLVLSSNCHNVLDYDYYSDVPLNCIERKIGSLVDGSVFFNDQRLDIFKFVR